MDILFIRFRSNTLLYMEVMLQCVSDYNYYYGLRTLQFEFIIYSQFDFFRIYFYINGTVKLCVDHKIGHS